MQFNVWHMYCEFYNLTELLQQIAEVLQQA